MPDLRTLFRRTAFSISLMGVCYCSNVSAQAYVRQNTWLDAVALADIVDSLPQNTASVVYNVDSYKNAFLNILLKYGDSADLMQNPFLEGYLLPWSEEVIRPSKLFAIDPGKTKPIPIRFETPLYTGRTAQAASIGAANWQASAINGLANFVAGRFKQEVFHVAFNQMVSGAAFGADSQFVHILFPKSYQYIRQHYDEGSASYYSADLQLLRLAAQTDIEHFPSNLLNSTAALFPASPDREMLSDMLSMSAYLVESGRQNRSLDALFSGLAREVFEPGSQTSAIFQAADIIQFSLLDSVGAAQPWVDPRTFLDRPFYMHSHLDVRYYNALLYQQLMAIPAFRSYLRTSTEEGAMMAAEKMDKLIRFVGDLNTTYAHLRAKNFTLTTTEDMLSYVRNVHGALQTYFTELQAIPELAISPAVSAVPDQFFNVAEAYLNKEYDKVIPLFLIEFGGYMSKDLAPLRSLTFLSDLALTGSPEAVEELLQAYALPIGSASIKRNSALNVSVNSYVGFTWGWETAYASGANFTSGNIGLTAPIGISVTTREGSITTFVSLLDLGSIVNQRFNSDSAFYSELRLEQFFTPGVGVFWNFPGLPISTGMHFNYIPNLRTIEYRSGNKLITENYVSVTRLNFTLLMDIPLFTLYHKDI